MAQVIGQLLPFAPSFTIAGFLPANGQLVSVDAYYTLLELLGIRFGGDAQSTFGVPNVAPLATQTSAGASGPGIGWQICTVGDYPQSMLGLYGEVRLWGNPDYLPKQWLPCDGRSLSVGSNRALFSVLGTAFGGDGTDTFALPNLPSPGPGLIYLIANTGIYPARSGGKSSLVEYYLGSLTMFAGNYAPQGFWACDGSLQSLSDNEALYSLLGNNWGGASPQTFALPRLSPFGGVSYLTPNAGFYPPRSFA